MRGVRYLAAIKRRLRILPTTITRRLRVNSKPRLGTKIYVGCGADRRDGYVHCDVRPMSHVEVVCEAWELDRFFSDSIAIYSRHMIEHLRFEEVERFFVACHTALRLGGEIEVVVPDMEFHIGQWNRAVWNEASWANSYSEARHSAAGFWGWQGEQPGDEPFWNTHKSGFNTASLRFFLARAGFSQIILSTTEGHLCAAARKMLLPGERQVAPETALIRADHRGRYRWAAALLGSKKMVYDMACGIGYGSVILAEKTGGRAVGVDLDSEAIAYATEFYARPDVEFVAGDILEAEIDPSVEAIVSFETIEHLRDPGPFLQRAATALPSDGRFICSTPNQDHMPYNQERFPFHVRHYRPREFVEILEQEGFHVLSLASQHSNESEEVREDTEGLFLLAVCQPRPG